MHSRTFARLAALAVLVLGIGLFSCIVFRGRSGDRIHFPLAPHLDVIEECDQCHEGVAGDQVDSSTRRALESACFECHGEWRDECSRCHADVGSAGRFPEKDRYLSFSHDRHLLRTHGDCSACHVEPHTAPSLVRPTEHPAGMPAHPECFACHQMQGFYDRLECGNCHRDLSRFGLEPYESFTHTVDFVRRGHAELARTPASAAVCAQCHEQPFCSECHADQPMLRPSERHPESVSRDFIHRGDYVFRHPWEARGDPASCLRCHGTSYCEDCHESRGLTETSAPLRNDAFRFHGPGVLVPGSSDFHGTAARRHILSCASCHSDGMSGNCVDCHQVGAFGGNPHPPGFRSRLSRTGAPVCRLCHR